MIDEIQFLLNEKRRRNETLIINFKLAMFTVVFITFTSLNIDKYIGANSTINDKLLLGMWFLYPIYLCVFKIISMKKYMIKCSKCDSQVSFSHDYKKSQDLDLLDKEACQNCQVSLSLETIKFKKQD